jgi:D-glycero-D-manno-heptose 1,7-bisphosphate phosphatase
MGSVRTEVPAPVQEPGEEVTAGRPAVFLDRDGTINEEVDFVRTPEQLTLIPGAADAIRTLNRFGFVTVVISNQSGVARGFLTEDDLTAIHARLTQELARVHARLDRIYYCPHHPTEGIPPYNIECECRKPAPGMLLDGERDLGIDLHRSFVVGDRVGDVLAGQAVGARTILVLTGYGRTALEEATRGQVTPDHIAPSITEAVRLIVGENGDHA